MSGITERPCRQLRYFYSLSFVHPIGIGHTHTHELVCQTHSILWRTKPKKKLAKQIYEPNTRIGNYQFKRFILFGFLCVIFVYIVFLALICWSENYQRIGTIAMSIVFYMYALATFFLMTLHWSNIHFKVVEHLGFAPISYAKNA